MTTAVTTNPNALDIQSSALEDPSGNISLDGISITNNQEAVPQCPTITPTVSTKELEESSLKTFREIIDGMGLGLDDHQKKDDMLLRWLRSRQMDPVKAAFMMKEDLQWRKDNGINKLLEWDHPAHLEKDFPFILCGPDKDGDLFGVITWKKMDVDGAVKAIHEGKVHDVYLPYLWKCLEIVNQIYRKTSTPERTVMQGTLIIDLEGFSMYQFASRDVIEIVLEVVRRYEASYPNMLKSAIVINTPIVFNVLWNAMKPFLSEYTLSRVQIYGWAGYIQDYKAILRNGFPADQLPGCYGGANTTMKIYEPKDGFANLQPPPLDDFAAKNMVSGTVPAGQKLEVDFQIVSPGSTLRWGFKTDYYDIGFSVVNEAKEEVVDNNRVDAHVVQQKGFIVCNTVGKYTLVFDNTFSKYRAKSVYYTVSIVP